jgi:hypothetical protein
VTAYHLRVARISLKVYSGSFFFAVRFSCVEFRV